MMVVVVVMVLMVVVVKVEMELNLRARVTFGNLQGRVQLRNRCDILGIKKQSI